MRRFVDQEEMNKVTKFDPISFHVLESMEDLVRVTDLEGEVIFENKAMEVTKERLKEKGDDSFEASFESMFRISKNINATIKREIDIDDKIYSAKVSPITDDDGNTIGFVEVFRDITTETQISIELFNANKRINDEIILARNIQQAILPTRKRFKNIHFQYGHIPSDNLSGDIFDVIEIDDDRLGVYIADVVGHGISASIMTMFIRQTMRNILSEHSDLSPSETMMELKRRFSLLKLDESQYFTMIYALIDTKKGIVSYVNAGHNGRPILFNDERIAFMTSKGRFISNIFPNKEYDEKTLYLIPGNRFLFYTDGLLETTNRKGEFFGEERLKNWVMKNKNEEHLVDKLISDLNAFRWLEQKDDVAILYMDVKGDNNEA